MTEQPEGVGFDGMEHTLSVFLAAVLGLGQLLVWVEFIGEPGTVVFVFLFLLFVVEKYAIEVLLCQYYFGQSVAPINNAEREAKRR